MTETAALAAAPTLSAAPEGESGTTLGVILEWFRTLPRPTRDRLSIAHLHSLSKALIQPTLMVAHHGPMIYDALDDALACNDQPQPGGESRGEVETQWEVWQGDDMVASSDTLADARHYHAVYSQDGPTNLVKAVTIRSPVDGGL